MTEMVTGLAATVVIPTYNESENLPVLIQRICKSIPDVEIVVVDDASGDGTAAVARELGTRYPVRVVERHDDRGLSTAVLRGMEEARSDVCVIMDADLSHAPESIPALVKAVREGADIAVGSRYVAGGDIDHWPLFRRFASKAGTWLARPITSVRDPMSGFFCLRKSLLPGVCLKPRGYKILLEILARTGTRNVVEVPIRFEDRAAGSSKFSPKERREYLKQIGTLYRELNAWPWRVAKFLIVGSLGTVLDTAVLSAVVRGMGESEVWKYVGAVAGFLVAMTFNFVLNRAWTFLAGDIPVHLAYPKYALGTLGGLAVKTGTLYYALPTHHYLLINFIGIVLGTIFNFLASQIWAFSKRQTS